MKKIAIILSLVGAAAMSYGQGYVSVTGTFQNQTNTTSLSSSYLGGTANGGTSGAIGSTTSGQTYYVTLLTSTAASPTTSLYGDSTLSSDWLSTGLQGGNNTFTGRLTIGAGLQALNAAVGNSQSWILVAWSSSLGSTWAAVQPLLSAGNFGALSGYLGWSTVGVGAAGAASPSQPLIVTGTPNPLISTGFNLMQVTPAPEPGTIALAGLGIASLLALRRKK